MLIFIPLTPDELATLRADGLRDVAAHATTPALLDVMGYGDGFEEDAEFAALTFASVASLTKSDRRLVAVATVPDAAARPLDDPDGFGLTGVADVAWKQVSALFAGDPDDAVTEEAAAAQARGMALADAWEADAVEGLVADTDLMWFSPDEVDEVARLVA